MHRCCCAAVYNQSINPMNKWVTSAYPWACLVVLCRGVSSRVRVADGIECLPVVQCSACCPSLSASKPYAIRSPYVVIPSVQLPLPGPRTAPVQRVACMGWRGVALRWVTPWSSPSHQPSRPATRNCHIAHRPVGREILLPSGACAGRHRSCVHFLASRCRRSSLASYLFRP